MTVAVGRAARRIVWSEEVGAGAGQSDESPHAFQKQSLMDSLTSSCRDRKTAPVDPVMATTPFTVRQGQYLAFIDQYRRLHGMSPAESDFRRFFQVTPPVVHQMIKTLHGRGFIEREPGSPLDQASAQPSATAGHGRALETGLLEAHPALVSDARRAADSQLATVSFSDVADKVCAGLQALDMDDLDAGPRASGYVEPSEAAWDAIEAVVAPHFHDLERRIKLRREAEVLEVCSGIVTGLAEHSGFELQQYAEDAPSELASRAVDMWRRRRRTSAFSRHFIEKVTPDWDWLAK